MENPKGTPGEQHQIYQYEGIYVEKPAEKQPNFLFCVVVVCLRFCTAWGTCI